MQIEPGRKSQFVSNQSNKKTSIPRVLSITDHKNAIKLHADQLLTTKRHTTRMAAALTVTRFNEAVCRSLSQVLLVRKLKDSSKYSNIKLCTSYVISCRNMFTLKKNPTTIVSHLCMVFTSSERPSGILPSQNNSKVLAVTLSQQYLGVPSVEY